MEDMKIRGRGKFSSITSLIFSLSKQLRYQIKAYKKGFATSYY